MFWYKWANQMDNKWWNMVIISDIDQTLGKATNLEHRAEGWQLMKIRHVSNQQSVCEYPPANVTMSKNPTICRLSQGILWVFQIFFYVNPELTPGIPQVECCHSATDLQHLCGDDCTLRKVSGHVAGAERPAGDIWHDFCLRSHFSKGSYSRAEKILPMKF